MVLIAAACCSGLQAQTVATPAAESYTSDQTPCAPDESSWSCALRRFNAYMREDLNKEPQGREGRLLGIHYDGYLMLDAAGADSALTDGDQIQIRRANLGFERPLGDTWRMRGSAQLKTGRFELQDLYLRRDWSRGTVTLGNQTEPFGLEDVTSAQYTTLLERSLSAALVPARNIGAAFARRDDDWYWSIGTFAFGTANDGLRTKGFSGDGRLVWSRANADDRMLHLGQPAALLQYRPARVPRRTRGVAGGHAEAGAGRSGQSVLQLVRRRRELARPLAARCARNAYDCRRRRRIGRRIRSESLMSPRETLLLSKAYIHERIAAAAYLPAMRDAFLALDRGELQNPSVGHLRGDGGGVHIKAAAGIERFGKIAVKINANFPENPSSRGLPTIQGVIALFDAQSGELLALMDSIEITARRTAAASTLAAQHLARAGSRQLGIVGCGMQALYHLEALRGAFALARIVCSDVDAQRANAFARSAESMGLSARVAGSAAECAAGADILVTCTPSVAPILRRKDVEAGCFIAAVGTDSPGKHEIAPDLMAASRVVPDDLAQALEMGDTHQAVSAGAMTPASIHAELCAIVSGRSAGRTSAEQVFIFDSTGMAIEDLAAADLVFAHASGDETAFRFALNAGP